jgi:hypothetical protein
VDRADLSGRRRALGLLSLALVCSMTTWFSATAVVPQLRSEWGLGDTAAAWLTIAVQVGFVVGALVASALSIADLFSPRLVILVGAVGAAGRTHCFWLQAGWRLASWRGWRRASASRACTRRR